MIYLISYLICWVLTVVLYSFSFNESFVYTALYAHLVFGVGFFGLFNFVGHSILSEKVAKTIGWNSNGFQKELGFVSLGIGICGVLCHWFRDGFWLATAIPFSVFLIGAALLHIAEMKQKHNFNKGNVWIILPDLLMPFYVINIVYTELEMKIIAMIPARYGATRFPAKLMQDLYGKPVIVHTYERVAHNQLFGEVYVVTDDDRIENAIREVGGKVIRSKKEHHSGSDRLAEASKDLDVDIIVNVQGDEPFTDIENLRKVIDIFANDSGQNIAVASLMERITDPEEIANPNNVKVVVNKFGEALYFSRSVIPFQRDANTAVSYYKHIGIYAYRKEALQQFTLLPSSLLEETEKLEQLRYLENGFKIRLALTDIPTIGIDTPEDLEKARERLSTHYATEGVKKY